MAFVLKAKSEGFFFPIQLPIITDSGATTVAKFEMKFKRVSRSKLDELTRAQEELNKSDIDVHPVEKDTDYVLEVAEGWRHVNDDTGKEVPFSREAVFTMLDKFPNAAHVIVSAFITATLGGGKRGN